MYQIRINCDGRVTAYMAAKIVEMTAIYCHVEKFEFDRRYDLSMTVDRIDVDLLLTISNLYPIGIHDISVFDKAGYIVVVEGLN